MAPRNRAPVRCEIDPYSGSEFDPGSSQESSGDSSPQSLVEEDTDLDTNSRANAYNKPGKQTLRSRFNKGTGRAAPQPLTQTTLLNYNVRNSIDPEYREVTKMSDLEAEHGKLMIPTRTYSGHCR